MKYLFGFCLVVIVVLAVASPADVLAQTGVQIPNPIRCNDINCLVSQIIRYILGTIAVIATFMFIWGGLMMLTSGGNADRVRKARETLAWASIGLVVIMLSWAIISFVLKGITNTATTSTPPATGCCRDAAGSCQDGFTAAQCSASAGSFYSGQACSSLPPGTCI